MMDTAVTSFCEVYYRFQPLVHKYAHDYGVEVDDLGNVLGRAILMYDKRRGFKFYRYLEQFLLPEDHERLTAKELNIDGHVFNKLKAALMHQESLGFPFLSR